MTEPNPIHESIKESAYWLQAHGWPGVWKWIQKKVNTGGHPEGILIALKATAQFCEKTNIKSPWAYTEQVYKINNPHCWEREGQREAEMERLELDELVNDLKQLRRIK